jgi:hypothetical protein
VWPRRLVVVSIAVLVYWAVATLVAVQAGWPAEFSGLGDPSDVSGEWASRGTLVSPPLLPMVAQAALTLLVLVDRRSALAVAGFGLAAIGALYAIGGLGEPLRPDRSGPPLALYWILKALGIAGGLALGRHRRGDRRRGAPEPASDAVLNRRPVRASLPGDLLSRPAAGRARPPGAWGAKKGRGRSGSRPFFMA